MGLTWILGTRWWLQLEQPRESAQLVVSSLWHSWSDHSGKTGVVFFLLPADFCLDLSLFNLEIPLASSMRSSHSFCLPGPFKFTIHHAVVNFTLLYATYASDRQTNEQLSYNCILIVAQWGISDNTLGAGLVKDNLFLSLNSCVLLRDFLFLL